MRGRNDLPVASRAMLEQLEIEGWVDGLTIPIEKTGRLYGIVSLAATAELHSSQARSEIVAVSYAFHERVRVLAPHDGFRIPPAGLTCEELACLREMASGYPDIASGEHLHMTGTEVHAYIESAKKKFGARNRAELAYLAGRLAIV